MANILYRKQKQQKSLDNGVTWIDTGEYRVGAVLENPSNCIGTDSRQCRWVELPESEGYYCDGYSKYTMQVEECTENGLIWTRTGNSKRGSKLIDSDSIDCGYIPIERWVISETPIVCECGSVIYYEYKETYDDGVWTPTGDKRETEDFAITSGWSCYEESWDEGTDEYTLEIVKTQSPKNEDSLVINYCYYNDKIIALEKETVYEQNNQGYWVGTGYYKSILNIDGEINELITYSTTTGYEDMLFVINDKVYLLSYDKRATISTFDLNTKEIDVLLDGYRNYCGYKISYNKYSGGTFLGNYIYDAETNTEVQVAGNSGNDYTYTGLLGDGNMNYPTCDCMESSWASMGLLLGKGYRLDFDDTYSNNTVYKNLTKVKWFKITSGVTTYIPPFIPQIIEQEETSLLLPTRHGGGSIPVDNDDNSYQPMYKENNHRHVTSFVYKGNTLFYKRNIYTINSSELISDEGFDEYYLTDNDNIVLGYRKSFNNYADGKVYLLKIVPTNTANTLSLSFTFSGTCEFSLNRNRYSEDFDIITATTSPYIMDLNSLGISELHSTYYMFHPQEYGNNNSLLTVDKMFDMSNVTDNGGMFRSCKKLTYINLSNCNFTFNEYSEYVFRDCTSLKTIDLTGAIYGEYYQSIGNSANPFFNCYALEKVILGDVTQEQYNWIYDRLDYMGLHEQVTIEYNII